MGHHGPHRRPHGRQHELHSFLLGDGPVVPGGELQLHRFHDRGLPTGSRTGDSERLLRDPDRGLRRLALDADRLRQQHHEFRDPGLQGRHRSTHIRPVVVCRSDAPMGHHVLHRRATARHDLLHALRGDRPVFPRSLLRKRGNLASSCLASMALDRDCQDLLPKGDQPARFVSPGVPNGPIQRLEDSSDEAKLEGQLSFKEARVTTVGSCPAVSF